MAFTIINIMSKNLIKCSEAKKPNLVESQVMGEPVKEGKNPKDRIFESISISFLRQYSKKQIRRIERIKRINELDSQKYKIKNDIFTKHQDFNKEIKIMNLEIKGAFL